jgi:hypothetical protein
VSAPHIFGLQGAALISTDPRDKHPCRCGNVTSVFINVHGETRCLLCVSPGVKIVHVSAAEIAGWIPERKS